MRTGLTRLLSPVLLVVALMALGGQGLCEVTGWELRSSMPDAMYFGTAVADGAVFYTGGLDSDDVPRATVVRHDPCWDTWLIMAPMNADRYAHGAVALDGGIYVIGGRNESGVMGSVERYDPLADSWETVSGLSTARYGHGVATYGNRIYVFGGLDASDTYLNSGEFYDPVTDTWFEMLVAQMADARAYFPLAVFPDASSGEEELFALAGETSGGLIRSTESLPFTDDAWSVSSNLGVPRSHFSATEMYNSIFGERYLFAIGGSELAGPSVRVDALGEFSVHWNATGTVLNQARYAHGSCALGNVIHVLGGYDSAALNSHEASIPNTDPGIYRAVVSMNTASDGSGDSMVQVALGTFTVHILLDWAMSAEVSAWEGRIDMSDNVSVVDWSPGASAGVVGELPGNVRVDFDEPQDAGGTVLLATLTMSKTDLGPAFFHVSAHDASTLDQPAPGYADGAGAMLPMDGVCGTDGQPLFMVLHDGSQPPPTDMTVDYSGAGNVVSWNPAPGAVEYRIYRSLENPFEPLPENLAAVVMMSTTWWDEFGSWSHSYLMTAVDQYDGESEAVAPSLVTDVDGRQPYMIRLLEAFPNPFNPQTTIAFELPNEQVVNLSVHDVSGRLVDVLLDGDIAAQGRNEVVWRGRDMAGRVVSAGVYFYRLEAGSFSETKRMVLVK